jgi:hypothetical protein
METGRPCRLARLPLASSVRILLPCQPARDCRFRCGTGSRAPPPAPRFGTAPLVTARRPPLSAPWKQIGKTDLAETSRDGDDAYGFRGRMARMRNVV